MHRRPPKPCYGRVAAVGYSVLFSINFLRYRLSFPVALDCKTFWLSRTYPALSKTAEFPKSHPREPHKEKSPGLAAPGLFARLYVLIPNRWHTLRT